MYVCHDQYCDPDTCPHEPAAAPAQPDNPGCRHATDCDCWYLQNRDPKPSVWPLILAALAIGAALAMFGWAGK
jgi:hypothetical protein